MTPTYNCKHHHWQSWNQYGVKMPESGCKLKGGLFDCGYLNAERCPNFEPKEQEGRGMNNGDLISREALLKAIEDYPLVRRAMENVIDKLPAVDAVPVDTVSKMFCDFTGDSCACDFNGNDEWLSEVCELQDECPYPKYHLGCWKQYIKHYGERKE